MYLQHFGLRQLPFETTSNGTLYVDLPSHREAMNTILFGLRSGEGFIKVVGEVGTGKTALCRNLLRDLDSEAFPVYLPNPAFGPSDLLLSIADELGVLATADSSPFKFQKQIREVLLDIARDGGHVFVFVDEAQTMPTATLEQLRLLTNFESNHGKLLQVILFGQPELDERLADHGLRQLQQRIAFTARLEPLDREACRLYVQRRLIHCGARARTIFTPSALDQIHRRSSGIPRLINILAHKSLLAAYAEGEFLVDRRHVARAVRDTEGIQRWRTRRLFGRTQARPSRSDDRRLSDRFLAGWG
jgi:MSHA biogenesis protein MshM